MPVAHASSFAGSLIAGGGESGRLIAARDWSLTGLGPIDAWPQSLKTALSMILLSPVPIVMLWGEDGIMLYNDAYSAFAGGRHPQLLGSKVREGWPEVADFNDNVMKIGLGGGTLAYKDQELTLYRHGVPEQVWMNLDYSPVLDERGEPAGVIAIVVETTERVLAERRQAFRLTLEEELRDVIAPAAVAHVAANALGRHLKASRVGYAELHTGRQRVLLLGEWQADGSKPMAGGQTLAELCPGIDCTAGRTIAISSTGGDAPGIPAHLKPQVVAPLVKAGHLAAVLFVHSAVPRRWAQAEVALVGDVAGQISAAIERAQAQKALRSSEERFRALVTATAYAVYRMSPDWTEMRQLVGAGFLADTLVPTSEWLTNYLHPDDQPRVLQAIQTAIRTRSVFELEHRVRRTDGTLGWTFSRAVPILDAEGGIIEWFGAANDVTARKEAEERLRASEEQLRLATEAAEVGLWDVDLVTDTLFWPARVKRMFGISPEVPVSMADFFAGLHPQDREHTSAAYMAAADPEERALYEVEYRTVGKEDGVIRWVAAKGRGVFDEAGRCVRVLGTAIDITRRKADEERLRELNETLERRVAEALAERKLLADIVDGTDVFVQVADRDFRWLAINRAAAAEFQRVFGVRRPQVGDCMLDLLADHPEDQARVRAAWSRAMNGEEFNEVGEFGDAALDRRHYEMRFRTLHDKDGRVIGAYQFVYDVTERLREQARLREAEAALQQALKMEAVGQLTGGIAHDFNNLLQGVSGSLDLIRRQPANVDRVRRWAEAGLQAAERGTRLTGQLLAFSRAQKIEAKPLIVRDLVEGMHDLLQRTLGPLVKIRLYVDDDSVPVLSDPTQLEMAVLNLAINARDAMAEHGELTIATSRRRVVHDAELESGEYVVLEVRDNGAGMSAEIAARAFDPFFTTKGVGKGTGLGLSQVYGIARQGGGTARIESRVGHGTTVQLFLRRTEQDVVAAPAAAEDTDQSPRQSANVLVIDDDDDVRRFLVDSLEAMGHRVTAAQDGHTGLALFDRSAPDVMVIDFAMAGMNGAEVARQVRERRPDMPIVFASGYSETAAIEGVGGPKTTVLRKPFRVSELEAAITDALDLEESRQRSLS